METLGTAVGCAACALLQWL